VQPFAQHRPLGVELLYSLLDLGDVAEHGVWVGHVDVNLYVE
jgi:hypothetical protein